MQSAKRKSVLKPARILSFSVLLLSLAACAVTDRRALDARYGEAKARNRIVAAQAGSPDYFKDVKPILDNRCVACHACYDAPCQLKLSSPDGIDRGANSTPVYNASRLFATDPSRLFIDATTTEGWRQRDFFPVLNERTQSAENNLEASVLHRMLTLKREHPLPTDDVLSDEFELGLKRNAQCPDIAEFDDFAKKHPKWGMPYALPALTDQELETLESWIENGAPMQALPDLSGDDARQVQRWESFFNQPSLQAQLMSRYIYEHLFLGHLYFNDSTENEVSAYFKLVRSSTPPGTPIEIIATRRPYDDPNVARVYYRLWRERATIVAKTHMPYALNQSRMKRWRELFLDNAVTVTELPTYETKIATNPFVAFKDIPVLSRYRFMLDEAQYSIMGFIKGPVCRGQAALNVIRDHFWVMFVNPEHPSVLYGHQFLEQGSEELQMPIADGSNASPLALWTKYARLQRKHLGEKEAFLAEEFSTDNQVDIDIIWDGDGHNDNAALTVFRHFDNATVTKGFVGNKPQTAWVIGYPELERIHYLLVAGYDVYGNVGHNLSSRLYMDFLRMEGEFNFLSLLPAAVRVNERDAWYTDATQVVRQHINWEHSQFEMVSGIKYETAEPKNELFDKLAAHLPGAYDHQYTTDAFERIQIPLSRLSKLRGFAASLLPEVSYLSVEGENRTTVFTLLRNTALTNVSQLFNEEKRRQPAKDSLTVAPGFIGAHPNAFYRVSVAEFVRFVDRAMALADESDYRRFATDYAVRRTNPDFWNHSDEVHSLFKKISAVEYGVLDYNRLENR